jgi:peptidyl-dipeptidase A
MLQDQSGRSETMRGAVAILFSVCGVVHAAHADETLNPAEAEVVKLHDAYVAKYKPLWLKAQAARWEALNKGSSEAYDRYGEAGTALAKLHNDHEVFARLRTLQEGGEVTDPLRRRLLKVMYHAFEPGQSDFEVQKRIIKLETHVERIFHTHRSAVGDKMLTLNEVREILRTTRDSSRAKEVWEAYMAVAEKTAMNYRTLVDLRNDQAHELGHESFFHMSLPLQEIGKKGLFVLFNRLHLDTRDAYARLKREIDADRAAHFGISESQLRPWHYGSLFFESLPGRADADYDAYFKGVDLVEASKKYFASFGLPCGDILERSALKPRRSKNPYAVTMDLDRKGDIRILGDLEPAIYGADALLYELTKALYGKHIRNEVPFILRTPPHGIPADGVAHLLRAMVRNEDWLINVRKMEPPEAARISSAARERLRKDQLIFSEWAQVIVRFEHGIYAKPQRNFADFWTELRKTHQLLEAPERAAKPDYAAEVHIATMPMYYHSLPMGEMFAAQLRNHMAKEVLHVDDPLKMSFYGHPEAGEWLRESVFGLGNLYSWNALMIRTAGGGLDPEVFREQLLGKRSSPPRPGPVHRDREPQ